MTEMYKEMGTREMYKQIDRDGQGWAEVYKETGREMDRQRR